MSIYSEENKVYENVLGAIGNTPVVRLAKIEKELKCELWGKCEFFNAGGSVKDRIGKRMVIEGEKDGKWKPGDTLIEPTSGNTGIGLSLASAVLGYQPLITMPKKMSNEKIAVLRALGANIIRTPTEAAFDDEDSHISIANNKNKEIENSHIPDQYTNENNPLAHYEGTAEELIKQFDGKIDMIVVGAGTGGTITGIAKKLKEKIPNVQVVGVDPYGSILAGPDAPRSYQVEGIGYDFLPEVFDGKLVDKWYKSEDKESFINARRLIREEGILCGGSSGSAIAGALNMAKDLKEGQRCVVILPDSIRNYLTKFADDRWMYDNEFYEAPASDVVPDKVAGDIVVTDAKTIKPSATCNDAIALFKSDSSLQYLPMVNEEGVICGLTSTMALSTYLLNGGDKNDNIKDAEIPVFRKLSSSTKLNVLRYSLDINNGICIVADKNEEVGRNKIEIKRISNERNRQATFTKRKNGLLKKAMELSILCGCEVVLLVVSDNKLYEYASQDLRQIIQSYDSYDKVHDSLTNFDYDTQFGGSKPSRKKRDSVPNNNFIGNNSISSFPSHMPLPQSMDRRSSDSAVQNQLTNNSYSQLQNIPYSNLHSVTRRQTPSEDSQSSLTPRTVQRYRAANKKYEALLNSINSHSLLSSVSNRNSNMIQPPTTHQSNMNSSSLNQNTNIHPTDQGKALGIFPSVSIRTNNPTINQTRDNFDITDRNEDKNRKRKKFDATKLTIKVPKYQNKQERVPVPMDPPDIKKDTISSIEQTTTFSSSNFPSMTPTLNLLDCNLPTGMSPLPMTPSDSKIPCWPWTPTPKDASDLQFDNYVIEEPPLKKQKLF